MTISARVIADSCWEDGSHRLTTFVLRYPRFIHSEFMTHRVFSRNAASSRAIPVQKMIDAILVDPAIPLHWGKNQPGMQAKEELSDEMEVVPDDYKGESFATNPRKIWSPKFRAQEEWLKARDSAIVHVRHLLDLGLHKQVTNRLLEPWMHIEVVVTATNWANFYALRDHTDAQPEIQKLAATMLDVHQASKPILLLSGQWHLPFIDPSEYSAPGNRLLTLHPEVYESLAKRSAARCARVSYLKHDGTSASLEEDLALFERLMGGSPKHASPTEHQARVPVCKGDFDQEPLPDDDYRWNGPFDCQMKPERLSNLRGWTQFRKLIQGETVRSYKGFEE